MKKNNKQTAKKVRRSLVAFLLMLSFVMTAGTFAYWATAVEGTSMEAQGTLTVGSGDNVVTEFVLDNSFNSGGLLVPAHQVVNSGDEAVGSVSLTYDIKWVEDELQTQLIGTETIGLINISHIFKIYNDDTLLNSDEYSNIYDLITVEYDNSNPTSLVLDADAKTFAFHITMSEPANQEEYNLISQAEIKIAFSYSIDSTDITVSDIESKLERVDNNSGILGYIVDIDEEDGLPLTNDMFEDGEFTFDSFVETVLNVNENLADEDKIVEAYLVIVGEDEMIPLYNPSFYNI